MHELAPVAALAALVFRSFAALQSVLVQADLFEQLVTFWTDDEVVLEDQMLVAWPG